MKISVAEFRECMARHSCPNCDIPPEQRGFADWCIDECFTSYLKHALKEYQENDKEENP